MIKSSMRVLFVDDEPALLHAIRDYLSIVHSINVDVCDSAAEALTREDLFSYDCLVLDYEMPDIDGIVLLKEIRLMNEDIPIIIFTGKGHEEVAMEAINAGADFYVKKGGNPDELFAELAHFINKGVSQFRAEQSLIENENRYRAVVEDLTEFVCRMDAQGTILFANGAFLNYLNVPADKLVGNSFFSLYPDFQNDITEAVLLCDPDNSSSTVELPYKKDNDRDIWHQWTIRAIFNSKFEIQDIQAVGRDISKQHEMDLNTEVLRKLGLTLATCSSLDNALSNALSAIIEISGQKTGTVYLYDKRDGSLIHMLDKGPVHSALIRLVEDIRNDSQVVSFFDTGNPGYMSMTDMCRYEGPFLSLSFIPIRRYNELTGWFITASETRTEVPTDIRAVLEGVASQIGNVLSRIEAEESLRDALIESEERYMQLSESSPDAIAILSGRKVVHLNAAALSLFEIESAREWKDKPMNEFIESDLEPWFEGILRTSNVSQGPSTNEGFLKTRNGRRIYGELITIPIRHSGDNAVLLIIRDKTRQQMQEKALIESEKRFRDMADLLPEPLFEADEEGRLTFCNRGVHSLLDIPDGTPDMMHKASDLVSVQEQNRFKRLMRKVASDMRSCAEDFIAAGSNPLDIRNIHLSLAPIIRNGRYSGIRGVMVDITEIKRYQEELSQIIEEKDILFRELHHRVKNNLQIISSILQLQEEYVSDKAILSALHDCEQRIDSMALVHETLYKTESLVDIPFDRYLEDLTRAVTEGFATIGDIRAETEVLGIQLELDTAVTIGLMVNELMINSMKYAFVNRPSGLISISFSYDDEQYTFRYEDNGIGLPDGFDLEKISSLGIRLIRILAKQIRGTINISSVSGEGMKCTVVFPRKMR